MRAGRIKCPKIRSQKGLTKPKNRTNSTKAFSEQFEGVIRSLPNNTRVVRQIAPESSPERLAKSETNNTLWPETRRVAPLQNEFPGSFARGRCRRGRSEIPHFCSKLQSFALVLLENKRKAKKTKTKKSEEQKNVKRGKFLRPHLHQAHEQPLQNEIAPKSF